LASNVIEAILKRMPESPGVYLMRDAGGTILYVGKAINLRNRVRSYFQAGQNLPEKTERMVSRVADIDFFIAASEQEALVLESTLVKQYHPHFNVRLKDDKSFPYLKIDIKEEWPKLFITRRMEQDGGRYFGPFTSAWSVKQTLRVLQNIFPLRICSKATAHAARRPCLEYHMKRCLAPCAGAVSKGEYAQLIREVILFLEGKQDRVVKELNSKMKKAVEALDFEKAAMIRDQIQAINIVIEQQKIAARVRGEQDVIAFAQNRDEAFIQVFFVRNGRLTGRESYLLQGTQHEPPQSIMTGFIKQYYASSPHVPPLLVLQYPIEDSEVIREWLQSKRGGKVEIQAPRRGNKKQLVDTVAENARQGLEHIKIKELAAPRELDPALEEVQKELGLKKLPERMEAYDISNIQGVSAVGSMVVFEKGKPKPAHYRRFKIKTVTGANDYAMMQEVLQRRFSHAGSGESTKEDTWAIMPDLVLIDGGKGQLNAAIEAMKESGSKVPVASLAKENEEIYIPGRKEPIVLPKTSAGLQLLQRLRDEAHRFAVSYFTRVHQKKTFTSALDGIPGIGSRRKRALLRHFGSVPGIREASVEELVAATGMTQKQAAKVKEYL
jgi:excinuclease ABC subunit C